MRVIVAYDQSSDKTLYKLAQQKKIYGSRMDILINKQPLLQIRTNNISNARNSILDRMREIGGQDYPVFIMMDFDDVCAQPPDVEVLKRVLARESEWDSISFNRPGYYDVWAVSIKPFVYSAWGWETPRNVVKIMREYIVSQLESRSKEDWLECLSAFNGFALYKTELFLKCRYDWLRPLEYISVEEFEENRKALQFLGTRYPFDASYLEPDCEHRGFHMSAVRKFGARIWISPEVVFRHRILGHA